MRQTRTEIPGWLFDVYSDPGHGVVVWFIGEDGGRYRFTQDLPVTFYVGGSDNQLETLLEFLKKQGSFLEFNKTKRPHLFRGEVVVVAIRVLQGAQQPAIFRKLHRLFPRFEYYDADIALPLRYHAMTNTFPLAFCTITADDHKKIVRVESNDSKWTLIPKIPALRILSVDPVGDPDKGLPRFLRLDFENKTETISTKDSKHLLQRFNEIVALYDPDIIGTRFGDKWLFPYLFSISKSMGIPFNPNRDKSRLPIRVDSNQFESYGRPVHRDQQTLLLGRMHIDPQNSMALDQNGLPGILEMARMSNLPIQNAARRSTGGAFVAMQVTASLQQGILVPIRKQERERFKRGSQLITADNGGVIFKPITGLHADVAEIDFFSMYPMIMAKWNISAETVGVEGETTLYAPGINAPISQDKKGIVAGILEPILEKRYLAKHLMKTEENSALAKQLEISSDFLKGLGWVSYGYQGFLGNRIGSIEAHEAINAVSRNVILEAKEAAEDLGYEVLHLYVDSLFVKVGGKEKGLDGLIREIDRRTQLKVDLEGILRWIVSCPRSKMGICPCRIVTTAFFKMAD